jgi:hypothetical protein
LVWVRRQQPFAFKPVPALSQDQRYRGCIASSSVSLQRIGTQPNDVLPVGAEVWEAHKEFEQKRANLLRLQTEQRIGIGKNFLKLHHFTPNFDASFNASALSQDDSPSAALDASLATV